MVGYTDYRGEKSVLGRFIARNKALSGKIEGRLPQAREKAEDLYLETMARYLASEGAQRVVDVGGGKTCHFAQYRKPGANTTIVAVDISAEELAQNRVADERIVADVTSSLPLGDGEVDLIASRFVLEHLRTIDGFVRDSARVLKRGGYAIHVFPSKFAPYALINRALPEDFARRLLYRLRPRSRGGCGFPAFYDRCYHSAVEGLFLENGFEVVESRFSYYQSHYFKFFVPLYLASALYEMLLRAVGARDLCPYVVIVARKR